MKATSVKKIPDKRKNKVCVALGKRLKALRIAADKSQETLAFEAEIDRTFVSAIERGVANPSVVLLSHVCYALGVTLADLFEPIKIAMAPDRTLGRSNRAKPQLKPKKSRLR